MRLWWLVAAVTWLGHVGRSGGSRHRGHEARLAYRNEWAVRVEGGEHDARLVAAQLGLRNTGHVKGMEHVFLLMKSGHPASNREAAEHITRQLTAHHKVRWAEQQFSKRRSKRDAHQTYNDPRWEQEWYIDDAHQSGTKSTGSMHVQEVVQQGLDGRGVSVVVIDDGLEYNNTDIVHAYDAGLSYDVVDDDDDPFPFYTPSNSNGHGTMCAGIVSMQPNNSFCGVGIAPSARLGAIRLLDDVITDRTEAEAFSMSSHSADVMSVSWGPTDDGSLTDMPGHLLQEAMETAVEQGRGGRGVVIVWANGNGGYSDDNCACDGYASSPLTLAVGSVDHRGRMPWYGEQCAATIAVTYVQGDSGSVVTTQLHNGCTAMFSGTSASAPMAAGIVALLLQVNPELTWRDVQHLFVYTSDPDPVIDNGSWTTNAVGLRHNTSGSHRLGSGAPAEITFEVGCADPHAVRHLEHVQLRIHMAYSRRGALQMDLTSAQDTTTTVLLPRSNDVSSDGFDNFELMSVATWGENPAGKWTLQIRDDTNEENQGEWNELELILWGTEVPIHQMTPREAKTTPEDALPSKMQPFVAVEPQGDPMSETAMHSPVEQHRDKLVDLGSIYLDRIGNLLVDDDTPPR